MYLITKRILDIVIALSMLVGFAPVILVAALIVWLEDKGVPFHLSPRVGKDRKSFLMLKLRTMRKTNDNAPYITGAKDDRITKVGRFMRRYKIDELPQLVNVLIGNMSIVGPRPRMAPEISEYNEEEMRILSVKPGLTDIATILFSIEERKLLKDVDDPVLVYHQLLRPWKGLLGLFYIEHQSTILDIKIMALTGVVIFRRKLALNMLAEMMRKMGAPDEIVEVMSRKKAITPIPLPGQDSIIAIKKTA